MPRQCADCAPKKKDAVHTSDTVEKPTERRIEVVSEGEWPLSPDKDTRPRLAAAFGFSGTMLAGLWATGLWLMVPGNNDADCMAIDTAFAEAERKVALAGNDPAMIQQARGWTEQAVESFGSAVDWRIEVRWIQ
jgi:hypothetical protein